CWDILKSVIWYEAGSFSSSDSEEYFAQHGSQTLYPPQHTCPNPSCTHAGRALKKAEQRQVVVFTLDRGAIPARSVHLYCSACNTNYHHNFLVKDGLRTYYDGIPCMIQVGKHQFAERHVIELWISMMLLSWTSATNCAHLYNVSLANTNGSSPPVDWPFSFTVSTDHVWDAFVILALLEDCQGRSATLKVLHTGKQKDCFTSAIQA
ncbi:hypothetical protein F5887DRAFT_864218, partial [Amanita rubescens]